MPIRSYGVLKGRPISGQVQTSRKTNEPHFHIKLDGGGKTFDIAVNVQSLDKSEVIYHVEHDFHPPDPDGLAKLPEGFTLLANKGGPPNPLAIDFIREGLVHPDQMAKLEIGTRNSQNDLQNEVSDLTGRIEANPDAVLYAFGSQFPDGIHDIHMNQGNPGGGFGTDNGIYQDGALFINLPSQNRWLAVFIAFQTQIWQTDDRGNPTSSPTTAGTASVPEETNGNGQAPSQNGSAPAPSLAGRHRRNRHHAH